MAMHFNNQVTARYNYTRHEGPVSSPFGQNMFIAAAELGLRDFFFEAWDLGQDIEGRNQYGQSALHIAALHKDVPMCRLLLDIGADKFAKDTLGFTPIHLAADIGDSEVLELMLETDNGVETTRFRAMFRPESKSSSSRNQFSKQMIDPLHALTERFWLTGMPSSVKISSPYAGGRTGDAIKLSGEEYDKYGNFLDGYVRALSSHDLGRGMVFIACRKHPRLIDLLSNLNVDTSALEAWLSQEPSRSGSSTRGRRIGNSESSVLGAGGDTDSDSGRSDQLPPRHHSRVSKGSRRAIPAPATFAAGSRRVKRGAGKKHRNHREGSNTRGYGERQQSPSAD